MSADSHYSEDDRVRLKAYELWLLEGRPHGRDQQHWDMARELVAIEDSQTATLLPRSAGSEEPAEPSIAFENYGEFPTLTDQGDSQPGPNREAEMAGDQMPVTSPAEREADAGTRKAGGKAVGKAGNGKPADTKPARGKGASKADAKPPEKPKGGRGKSAG